MDERLATRPMTCHDTYRGHVCRGRNGECVRRGYHACAVVACTASRQSAFRWPYVPPLEHWASE